MNRNTGRLDRNLVQHSIHTLQHVMTTSSVSALQGSAIPTVQNIVEYDLGPAAPSNAHVVLPFSAATT